MFRSCALPGARKREYTSDPDVFALFSLVITILLLDFFFQVLHLEMSWYQGRIVYVYISGLDHMQMTVGGHL